MARTKQEESNWAKVELTGVDLNGKRLDKRLVKLVELLSNHPSESIPANCSGWNETKVAYRFFE